MANFLTTLGTSNSIEQLILNTRKNLTLVTPYLKLSTIMIDRIKYACTKDIKITLIYGKSHLEKKEKNILSGLSNVQIYFCQNLHAKCYFNEDSLIITSMNLYEYSQNNNREMGIEFDKESDKDIFLKAIEEVNSIKNSSILEKDFSKNNIQKKIAVQKKDILKLDKKEYWDLSTFHLPALKRYFEIVWPENETILYPKYLKVKNFPKENIDLEVNHRVDFKFKDKFEFETYKEKYNPSVGKGMEGIRFYWNDRQLNVYPEKKFVPEKNTKGLENMFTKYLVIIDTVIKNSDLTDKEMVLPIE